MNKRIRKIFIFSLLCIFIVLGLTACGKDGVKVKSANALARKLTNSSTAKINVTEELALEEPIVITGEKEIVGEGTITAAMKGSEEVYMITVAEGGKLTIGGSVKIDAASLMGAVHVQDGGSVVVKGKAVVKNASEAAANALVEGSLEVKGGNLKGAKGHNIINKNTTTISGGKVTGSGDKYAAIYNEATLTQSGGKVSAAYNNISNLKGSTFTFEGGTNEDSIRDGVFVAQGAVLKATNKDATIVNAGARGILLQGQADIKVITVKECGDTLVKVAKTGVLNLGNGVLQGGNYHGVDNAGTMNMLGGNISLNDNCGIVNTGTLKVTSGNISENANKGILNKHEGKADVTSAMVTFTSNKTAIANEDKAVFEFAKAKLLMSTQTNIYCYDGTMNIHDASLNASTSNNVRIVDGVINMTNVEVKGNSQKSGTSHHGIYMEGGVINAENVTVSMTTGHGIRNKGGVFKGKNIIMHDINRVAVSQGKHDYLEDVEGLTEIEDLEIQSTNYANIWNEGGGTIKITNGKLAVASSNSVRSNDGKTELTNVTIPGHKEGSKNNIHGIYLEGGEIVAKNVVISNTSGNAIRNKNGKFIGTKINISNVKGDTAIANLPLDDDNKNGIVNIDGLTIKKSSGKNITLDSGVTTIKNATLGAAPANNIKLQNNAATLNLYNVAVEGQVKNATVNTHGIMVEGGNVYGEKVEIFDTNACGIRCKLGKVDLKDVTMTNLGQAGISNSKMEKNGELKGVGDVTIDGLIITKAGTNNVLADAGKVTIINGVLGKVETNNHNVKISGTGLLVMDTVKVEGTSNDTKYGIIAEGGEAKLKNVQIYDLAKSGIHANKETSKVTGTNVVIKDAVFGITGSNGSVAVEGLTTENISGNNVLADKNLKVTITNSTGEKGLGATAGHNAKATGDALVTLKNVEVKGVTDGSKHAIMAEGGDFVLKDVLIRDVKNTGIRINKVTSSVDGKNVTIKNAENAVTGTYGTVKVDVLITENIKNNNIFCGNDTVKETEDKCIFTISNATLCKSTSGHNVKATGSNAKINLKVASVNGTDSKDHCGIIAEKGSAIDLTDVTVTDVKGVDKAAIYSNNEANVVTGTNLIIKDSRTAVKVKAGMASIDGLITEGIMEKNILVEEDAESDAKATLAVANGELCQTSTHNVHVKDKDGSITLENVSIAGTTSNHGIMAEGGDATLTNVTISNVANAGIRINKATSKVKGTNIKITDSANGVTGSNGEVEIDKLTTSGIRGNNLLAESSCNMTVNGNSVLAQTTGGHNVKATGSGVIQLTDTTIEGTSSTGHHAVMAEGGDFVLDNVIISGAKAKEDRAAIRINKASSEITGKTITITDCNLGISGTAGTVNIEDLTADAVLKNVEASGATITLKKSTLNATSENNVEVTADTLTLEDVAINGGVYGIYKYIPEDTTVTGGVLNAKKVTIDGTTKEGIWQEAGSITGENVTLQNTGGPAIENTKGASVEISDLTVSGVKNGHSIKNEEDGSTVVISGATIGKTPSNNIYVSGGTVTIKDATIEGTDTNHGVLAQGGKVVLEKVIIKNAAMAGIRSNREASVVEGKDITITDCADGITISDGSVEIENLDTTGVTGTGIKSSKTLKLAGKVKGNILLEEAVSLEATKALTSSVFTLDWAEGKIPTQDLVAVQFASEEDMQATKGNSTITFGANVNTDYVPYFYGTQLLLNDRSNIQYTVKNFAELQEVMKSINNTADINTATITVTGDIIVTEEILVKSGKTVRIQDNGTAKTIKRDKNYHSGFFTVEANATLTLASSTNDNKDIKLTVDGGSKEDIKNTGGCSLITNNGSVTVTSGVKLANNFSSGNNRGLGIYAAAGSTTTFSGIMENIVGTGSSANGGTCGSAIVVNGASLSLSNAIVKNNATKGSGVIQVTGASSLTATNTIFEGNKAEGNGGAVYAQGTDATFSADNCEFIGNEAIKDGGAISIEQKNEDAVVITNCKFQNNKTGGEGSSINVPTNALIKLENCQFTGGTTKANDTANSISGFGDVRIADNRTAGGIKISGKMVVDIYMNQPGLINVVGALAEESSVVANWRLTKISDDRFEGISYASEDVMNASKEYISLSNNYNSTYVLKNAGTSGTLVKIKNVKNETELKNAISEIGSAADKTGFIKVTENFTISATVSIPTGANVTIMDDGTARTITRAVTGKDKTVFDVKSGATFALVSTSENNGNPTLTIDGGSASITNTNGAALINASGTVNVGKGVVLTNNKSTGDNQGFGIYSQPGSVTTFSGVISNIEGTHTNVKGNVFVIKGTFTLKDAIVRDNKAKVGSPIRVSGGQLTALNTTFQGNSTNGNGGVLYADGTAGNTMTIDGCTFTGNTAGGHGGAISIDNKFDANTIKNSKFTNNTAGGEGGAINMPTGAFLTLENCEFTGNNANKVSANDSISGFGDVRVADNTSAGAIRISGKMIVDIYFNQAGKLVVNGTLTEGSNVIVNWRKGKITGNTFTGINFASAEVMETSKAYFELSNNYSNTYEVTFSGTSGILKKK